MNGLIGDMTDLFTRFGHVYVPATDEFRLAPHDTLPHDWRRTDG